MKKVGLIGYGYWGKILLTKLEKLSDVKFVCTSKDDYLSELDLVEWVFVATPNITHYEIVKECLSKQKNVFCEKPLTLTNKESEELFSLAEKNDIKLYVDDVFNYRTETEQLHSQINKVSEIKVISKSPFKNYLDDLFYHDLYLLYPILSENLDISWPKINNINFSYEVANDKLHLVDGIDFTHKNNTNDALFDMIKFVLQDNVDYIYNKEVSLFSCSVIEEIKRNMSEEISE
jgi:hypothetical protein